ncbi:MAG: hypothetical protein ACLQNE_20330 [Thermoguttaceae bacterium]
MPQPELPLAEAEGAYAERKSTLFNAVRLVRGRCELSRLLERLFDAQQAGQSSVVMSFRQLAQRPDWLCCSETTAKRIIETAVNEGLIDAEVTREGNRPIGMELRLNWSGIKATCLGIESDHVPVHSGPARSVAVHSGPARSVAVHSGPAQEAADGDLPARETTPDHAKERRSTDSSASATTTYDGFKRYVASDWAAVYHDFAEPALSGVCPWDPYKPDGAIDPRVWSDMVRLAALVRAKGWTADRFIQASREIKKPDRSTRVNVFKGIVAKKCGFAGGLSDPQFLLIYDAIEPPPEFLRVPERSRRRAAPES